MAPSPTSSRSKSSRILWGFIQEIKNILLVSLLAASSMAPPRRRRRHPDATLKARDLFEDASTRSWDPTEDCPAMEDARTTVVIRNLPSNLTRKKMMEMLDHHCYEENRKIGGAKVGGSRSEFDFLYVLVDFDGGKNLSYAFVNFTSPAAARRFHRAFHLKGWENQLLGSRKVKEIRYAKIQGLEELTMRFKNATFLCGGDDVLPAFFSPSRDGERETLCSFVGRRVPKKT